jgi:hypothetical protein
MHTQTFTLVTGFVVLTLGGSATLTAGQELPVPRRAEAYARGVAAIQRSQAVRYEKAGLLFLPSPVSTGYRLGGGTRPWRGGQRGGRHN